MFRLLGVVSEIKHGFSSAYRRDRLVGSFGHGRPSFLPSRGLCGNWRLAMAEGALLNGSQVLD